MTRSSSPRLPAYAALGALALVAALVSGRAELAVLAAPFVLVVGMGVATSRPPAVGGGWRLDRERAMEGERVHATVTVVNTGAGARVDVRLPTPRGVRAEPAAVGLWLGGGERREVRLVLHTPHWGAHAVGPPVLRARDRLGLFSLGRPLGRPAELRVYPSVDRLRALVAPLRTRAVLGGQVSPERGEGIEFADVRPLAAGDRARRVNWRATARRGVPYVDERHPERSTDVVLFLDTFAEARQEDEGTLDAAVRAAASLASGYLARRDRVALVSFGGVLRWLAPAAGLRQLYRIVDALLASEVVLSYAWKDVTILPRRLLPPRALVLALSPLLDARAVAALLDLRARGYDLAVVEVSPVRLTPPGPSAADRLAHRLWRLRRASLRARFEELGVPVARWDDPAATLDPALAEVTGFRRGTRPALPA